MNNILITGAHGFVGSNISEYLARKKNFRLYALDILKKRESVYSEEYLWNDISDIPFYHLDTIIHLAGKAHDTKNTSKENEYYNINTGLTKQVFDLFLKSKAKKFIYFSSVKAVTDTVKGDKLTEDETPNPQTPYGKSKLEAEKYIISQHLPEEKLIYILRPAMIHGPGNKGNFNLLYQLIYRGLPYPLGAYSNQRSFTSIANLNFLIEQLIVKDIPSGIYLVADNETLSTCDVIKLIAEILGKKPRIWKLPMRLIKIASKLGDYGMFPLNSEKLKKLTESYVVSNKKITKALDITLPVTAYEGLKLTTISFQNSHSEQ